MNKSNRLSKTVAAALCSRLRGWAATFLDKVEAGGAQWLLDQYDELVTSVETRSCNHGKDGGKLTGEKYTFCCGVGYEYRNDLSVRDALQVLPGLLDQDAALHLREAIRAIDRRLLNLYDEPVDENSGNWWKGRLPRGVEP